MKRILHVIDTTGPGGAETVFVELADRVRSHGFESVALLRGPGWVSRSLEARGITAHFANAKGSFNWRYLRELQRTIEAERIDLIQSHLLGSNVYCAAAGWLTHRPVVASFHGGVDIGSSERYKALKFWLMNRGVDRYVAVSQSLADRVEALGASRRKGASVIYNGIDVGRYERPQACTLREELGLPEDVTLVGSLGNVRPAKAYDVLIRAASEVCVDNPSVHFVVAGDINERVMRPLQNLLSHLALSHRVHFLGFREDVAEFLANLDLFVLSSRSEGFSIATIEAQAAGLPVIATRCGGPEEIIIDRETGLLVAVDDSAAMASAILECLNDESRMEALALAGKKAARQRFSIESMIKRYLGIYRDLLRS